MESPAPAQTAPTTIRPARRRWRLALRMVERLFAIIGLMFVLWHAAFRLTVITSGSMSPTLQGNDWAGGDWVVSDKLSPHFFTPHRWDLIHFRGAEGEEIMKRVVAFPGETVSVREGRVCVNGEVLERPATMPQVKYYPYGNLSKGKGYTVTNGFYVLGDDSADSEDSRYTGPVLAKQILGRPLCIVKPWTRAGWVNP